MAAPPDQGSPSMASRPAPAEQQRSQGPLLTPETDIGSAGLDLAVAARLVDKTTNLTISTFGRVAEDLPTREDSPGLLASHMLGTTPSLTPPMSGDTQPCPGTLTGSWGAAAPNPASEVPTGALLTPPYCSSVATPSGMRARVEDVDTTTASTVLSRRSTARQLSDLPNEVLLHILSYLDVCDLLATSRTSHHLRTLSLSPHLHHLRLRRTRAALLPLLTSPSRPSLADLVRRSIFLTRTTAASRRLAHSLASIRLARRLAARPPANVLVERCVLPRECLPSESMVAPGLVARKRAVERERVKDGLRAWVGSVMKGEVRLRGEGLERAGVGRVWRLRRFWERVGKGEV
ncbi:hypothetical protein MMYC01_200471 [Madurella mycetomatis]|uniref:F-box domain-containing protein n=1 Tax=Madurella mycetomatis TaxID=100816 RepID=A0A175WHK4_9PEZI|nr:hypothetical protein MMYC01_200471 [Madurella mycetomatis]